MSDRYTIKTGQCFVLININPFHAEFLKWNNQPYIFDTFHFEGLEVG